MGRLVWDAGAAGLREGGSVSVKGLREKFTEIEMVVIYIGEMLASRGRTIQGASTA